jgi:hypothetical protein
MGTDGHGLCPGRRHVPDHDVGRDNRASDPDGCQPACEAQRQAVLVGMHPARIIARPRAMVCAPEKAPDDLGRFRAPFFMRLTPAERSD